MSAQQQGEPGILLVMVLVLLAGLVWIFWHMTGDFWLEYFLRWLRYSELWILNLFTHRYDACLDFVRFAQVKDPQPSRQVMEFANACFGNAYLRSLPSDQLLQHYQLSLKTVSLIGAEIQGYYRWAILAALIWIGGYGIVFSPRYKFMTKHTLETLIATQAKMWPILSPIVKFNPSKSGRILGDTVPDKLPSFAEALSPEEWISWNRIPLNNGIPERDAVRRAFIQQLGPRWNGVESLPLHMKALLAAFVLRGKQKREESENILGKLAECWSPEKGFRPSPELVAEIKRILDDPEMGGRVVPVLDQHAWRTTAMLGALRWARNNGGVLAPASFLWLRAEDRALWYPLNNLGRRAFHSEGAGAMAHFMSETSAKKPLPIPRVDTAVVTLNTYLHDPDKRTIPVPPREEVRGA
jgi:intracellular multiplication protein IcmP